MSLPNTISEAIGPRERFFINAQLYACDHVKCMVVPCSNCGAKAGQYCLTKYGKETKSAHGCHIARSSAFQSWKRSHQTEFKTMTDEAFKLIVHKRAQR